MVRRQVHVAVRDALVRNLDVEELTFLVDMYSTELGKRVMKKMGKFMGEVRTWHARPPCSLHP